MTRRSFVWVALAAALQMTILGCGDGGLPFGLGAGPFSGPAYPEVWSINASDGQSYEFKSNYVGDFEGLETCFLWTVTAVVVESPAGEQYELEKDFNINSYSGEVTRRWVLYGPPDGGLPAPGEYRFLYYEGEELVLTQVVPYSPQTVGYPTDVTWNREGDDLVAEWTPPEGARRGMWYKVLLFPDGGDVISNTFGWNASNARLPEIPLAEGATGTLNVAIYFSGGFSPSEYLPFTW